jgi:hypothetical protein
MLRPTFGRVLRARYITPLALAGLATILAAGPAPATDRFTAGQVGESRALLTGPEGTALVKRARTDATTLGLPAGVTSTAARVTNRFLSTGYTEITALDSRGQPVSLLRYGRDGRIRTAVRLGWKVGGQPIDSGSASTRARTIATAAGMAAAGIAALKRTADDGFSVTWNRTVEGVPVAGDGVRVVLWADGSLHSVTTQERPLAAAPATQLNRADAEQRAAALLATWLRPAIRSSASITGAELTWIAPNDMFSAAKPDAPAATLRLAWVVSVTAQGALVERWQAMKIYLDAGDGSLLGGDLLQ